MSKTKLCHGCGQVKSIADFHNCSSRADGKQTRCKVCKLKDNTKYATAHPDKMLENNRRFRDKNPEAWREYHRKWRAANPAKARSYTRKWYKANPDKVMENIHKRRARLAAAEGSFTQYQWKKKKAEYGGCCAYCGVGGRQSLHHVVPLSKGGSNWIDNIVPACLTCNLKIGTKTVLPGARDGVRISVAGVPSAR